MAKKPIDVNAFLKSTAALLDSFSTLKRDVREEFKKKAGCKNHPDKIIYRAGLCQECDEVDRNLRNKKNAEKEPWVSTDGFMYIYTEDGKIKSYHRYVVEQYLGRPLRKQEKILFLDENPRNCELENLAMLKLVPVLELPS